MRAGTYCSYRTMHCSCHSSARLVGGELKLNRTTLIYASHFKISCIAQPRLVPGHRLSLGILRQFQMLVLVFQVAKTILRSAHPLV